MRNYRKVQYELNGETYNSEKIYDLDQLEAEMEKALDSNIDEVAVRLFVRNSTRNTTFVSTGKTVYHFKNGVWKEIN